MAKAKKQLVQRYQGGGQVQDKSKQSTGFQLPANPQNKIANQFNADWYSKNMPSSIAQQQATQLGISTDQLHQLYGAYNQAFPGQRADWGPLSSTYSPTTGQQDVTSPAYSWIQNQVANQLGGNIINPQQPQQAAQQQQQQTQQQQQQTPTVQVTPLQATPQAFAAQPGQTMNVPQGSATAAQPLFSLGQQGQQTSQLPQAQNQLLQQQQPQQYQSGGQVRSRDKFSYQPPQGAGLPSMTPPAGGPQPQPFAGTLPTPPQYPGLIYDPTTPPQPIQNQQFFYNPPAGVGLPSMTPPAGGPQLQPFAGTLPQPPPVQRFQGGGDVLQSGVYKDPKTGVVTYSDPALSSQLGLGNLTADQSKALGIDPYHSQALSSATQVGAQYEPYFLGAAALDMPAVINLPPTSSMNNPKGGVQTQPGGTVVGTSVPQVPQGPWLTNPSVFAKAAMPTVNYGQAVGWSGGQAGPLTAATPANAAQMPQYNIQQASAAPTAPGGNQAMAQGPNTDRVPASLTPGEFVMNRQATQMFGPQLAAMNQYGAAGQAPAAPGRQVNYVPQGFMQQGQPQMMGQGGGPAPFTGSLHNDPYLSHAVSGLLGLPSNPWHNPDGSPTAITQAIGGGGAARGATTALATAPTPARKAQGGGLMMQSGGYVQPQLTPQQQMEQMGQGYRNYLANTLAGRTQGYTGAEIVGDIGGPAPPQEQRQPQQQRMQTGGYVRPGIRQYANGGYVGDQSSVPAVMPAQASTQSQGSQQQQGQTTQAPRQSPQESQSLLNHIANNLSAGSTGGGVTGYQPPGLGATTQAARQAGAPNIGTLAGEQAYVTGEPVSGIPSGAGGLSNQQKMNIAGGIQQGFNQAAQAIAQSAPPWQWIPVGSWANPQQYAGQEQQQAQSAAQLGAQRST